MGRVAYACARHVGTAIRDTSAQLKFERHRLRALHELKKGLDPYEDIVRLTVMHEELEPDSDMLRGITSGWPAVLSSLKTFLETGKPMSTMTQRRSRPPE